MPASLGTALFYNAVIFGDLLVPNGSDTEGRLAVGGTATFLDNYVIGAPPPNSSPHGAQLPLDPTRDDLIVGTDIANNGGFAWVVNGNAVHEGTFTGTPLRHAAGTTRQQTPVLLSPLNGNAVTTGGQSFADLRAELLAKSQFWGGLADQGVALEYRDATVLNLQGNDPILNVFNVTAEQWSGTDIIRNIVAPAGSSVLINVSGTSITATGGAMRLDGITRDDLLVNFFQATTISSTLFDYQGNVLAPLADATFNGGILTGIGIFGGDVVQGGGFEMHNFSFRGNLPDLPAPPLPPLPPPPDVPPLPPPDVPPLPPPDVPPLPPPPNLPVPPPPPPPPGGGGDVSVFPPRLGAQIGLIDSPGGRSPILAPSAEAAAMTKRMLLSSTTAPVVNGTAAAAVPATSFPMAAAWLGPTRVAYATGTGTAPTVLVVDTLSGAEVFRFQPFPASFTGGLSVAGGDVTGDGVADVIVGAGPGGGPHVKVFDGLTGQEVMNFFAYDSGFVGGVTVAAGDVNGDGRAEVVTAPASAGGPHVRVFDAATGRESVGFFAYAANVVGGVNVSTGDTDGDGRAEVITSPAAGFAPHVRVWRVAGGTVVETASFFAFDPSITCGVFVAAADVNGDGRDELLASPGVCGGPILRAFSGSGDLLFERMVFAADYRGGMRLAAGDFNGDLVEDVVVTPGFGERAVARLLTGPTLSDPTDFDLAATFPGVFVG